MGNFAFIFLFGLAVFLILFSGCIQPRQDCTTYKSSMDKEYCYIRQATNSYIIAGTPAEEQAALQICETDTHAFKDDCYHAIVVAGANKEVYKNANNPTNPIALYPLIFICRDHIGNTNDKNQCFTELAEITHREEPCAYIEESSILTFFKIENTMDMCLAKARSGY